VKFVVDPADAPELAITVDGEPIEGGVYTIDPSPGKRIKVAVNAKGYRAYTSTVKLGKEDQTLFITLKKATSSSGGTSRPTKPKGPGSTIKL
jgi:hypothetical protein